MMKRKEPRAYWSEELIKTCESMMNGEIMNTEEKNKWHDLRKNPLDLPPNAKDLGAICPKYDVMTQFGQTVGWFNPDFNAWYILVWLIMYQEPLIDFEKGDTPKIIKCHKDSNAVIAWREIDEYEEET